MERRDERELKNENARICPKCGASFPSGSQRRACPACLLETVLGQLDGKSYEVDSCLPRPLTNFGDYEILEEIGRGGQGVVFRARQKSLNRTVALKVISLGPWATNAHLKRFQREAESAASLEHPGIVPIYEVGERAGSCYFSMQCIEGGQLDELVRREPLPIRAAVELIVKLARTVHYAHERGILHRDIKPANILIDSNGEPRLMDFGLARLVETESTVTRTADVLGTPSYIAPEQASGEGQQLTRATDVYGLGGVLYQLLTGQPPFAGGTTYETIRQVIENHPRRPRVWNPKVDRDLETICLKCLAKSPSNRYPSAVELADDLERWLRHEPIHARRIGFVNRSYKWVQRNQALSALFLLSGALATVIVLFLRQVQPQGVPQGIAVLPFENLSDNEHNAALVDGIQDDVLTKLAKIADLKVISRTSVLHFRGEHDIRKIGRALGVSHVLEGSVRRDNNRIRLNAQLIDSRTDQHVWAEQYDRDLTDVFTIQSELAQKIAQALSATITRAERAAIQSHSTKDLEAYQLYIQAKQLLGRVGLPAIPSDIAKTKQAISLLDHAIVRDPDFALAYCLLAQAHLDLYWQEPHSPVDRDHAQKALSNAQLLAPTAGETHFAEAYFHYCAEHNYQQALGELETAMGLLPNDAEVFELAGRLDRRLNRWTDSIRHSNRAIELDPHEFQHLLGLNMTYHVLRRYREAGEIADRGIAAYPDTADVFWLEKSESALAQGDTVKARRAMQGSSTPNSYLLYRLSLLERNFGEAERACTLLAEDKELNALFPPSYWEAVIARVQGDREKGRASYVAAHRFFENLLRDRGEIPEPHQSLALLDALYGSKEEAVRHALRAMDLMPVARDPLLGTELQTDLAAVYAWTGDRDKAIEQLASVIKQPGSISSGELKLSPIWDPLRSDPRLEQLIAEAAEPLSL